MVWSRVRIDYNIIIIITRFKILQIFFVIIIVIVIRKIYRQAIIIAIVLKIIEPDTCNPNPNKKLWTFISNQNWEDKIVIGRLHLD
jgi:hypothetical protein